MLSPYTLTRRPVITCERSETAIHLAHVQDTPESFRAPSSGHKTHANVNDARAVESGPARFKRFAYCNSMAMCFMNRLMVQWST